VKKYLMILTVLSLMFSLFTGSAMASQATATAEFTWSALTYDKSMVTITDSSTYLWAAATDNNNKFNPTQYGGGTGWGSYTVNNSVDQANSGAGAISDASKLTATSTAGPTGTLLPNSSAYASRTAAFSVQGNGDVTFSVPYTLTYTASASPGPEEKSWGRVIESSYYAYLTRIVNGAVIDHADSHDQIATWIFAGDPSNTDSKTGIASVKITGFRAGETGTILFQEKTDTHASAVPIPAGVWLLGSGFLGLVGIVRRKVTKA